MKCKVPALTFTVENDSLAVLKLWEFRDVILFDRWSVGSLIFAKSNFWEPKKLKSNLKLALLT